MKKALCIIVSTILCLLFATLGVSASSDVDNEKYIPKVITTDNGYKMMFDSELARIARRMSSDSYKITSDSKPEDIATTYKEEGFVDIQQSHSSDDAILDIYSNNFLVGVKTFEVDGEEKYVMAITFRGTDWDDKGIEGTLTDLIFTDASVIGVNGYHSGFYGAALNAFDTLYDIKFETLNNMTFSEFWANSGVVGSNYSILVTGHSLGGAVANIFTGDLLSPVAKNNVMCYTFASPIVCSPTKAKEYDAYNIFNIINEKDTIPKLGYNIFSGVRLGTDLKVTVTDSEESAHNLKVTYEKATNQVINKMDSLYPYIHRVCNDTTDEIHIHTNCSLEKRRFSQYLGNSDFFIYKNVKIGTECKITGDLKVSSNTVVNADVQITGDLSISTAGTVLEIGNAKMEVGGNVTQYYGTLKMANENGYFLVHGNYRQYSGVETQLTAGVFEIKGDMVSCSSYQPSNTHRTILSGNEKQQINLYGSRSGHFNILEITNTSNEGVEFTHQVNVHKELFSSDSSNVINGKDIHVLGTAVVRGMWNGDLSASGWICEQPCIINGNLKVSSNTVVNADVQITGDLSISSVGTVLEIGNAKMEVGGNVTQYYGTLKMANENGYFLVHGNYRQYSGVETQLTAGVFEIKGDMVGCDKYKSSGVHKTILSGESEQEIDLQGTYIGDFNLLEVANVSTEGVKFTGKANVIVDILQPTGTKITNGSYVKLQNKTAFVDYAELNSQINIYNSNEENVIPTWLDYERYCKFALDGDKAFTLNETITNTSFDCDLYFSNGYNKSSAIVIVAFYDGDNRFVQMASKPVDVKEGKIDVSIDYENKPYSKYKIMVWEGFDNLQPLMAVK